jgi:hypothetical protein
VVDVLRPHSFLPSSPAGGGARRRFARSLAVGAVVTGLGALAGCGGAEQSATAASSNLADAKAAAFTVRLSDPKGSLATGATNAQDRKTLQYLLDSTVTVTVDPAGDSTLGEAASASPSAGGDLAAELKNSGSMAVDLSHAGTQVIGLKMIDGMLYARADLNALSELSGESLSEDLTGAPPQFAPIADGLKAGKWLSLDLPTLMSAHPELSGATSGSDATPGPAQLLQLRSKLLSAFQANSTKTVTASDGRTEVQLKVKAKGFLTAALAAVDGAGLPTGSSLKEAKSQLGSMPDGDVDALLTIEDGHYVRAALDVHSVAELSTDSAAKAETEGVQVLVDIDDRASGVSAPEPDQVVNANGIVDSLTGQRGADSKPSLTPELSLTP